MKLWTNRNKNKFMERGVFYYWPVAILFCLLVSFDAFSQIEIDSEDFESGDFSSTIWNDGGSNCVMTSYYSISGSYSPYVRGNTDSSVMYTDDIDISSYDSVTIEFDFKSYGFDSGEDFFLEFSDDGGSTWDSTPILNYIYSTDFSNGTKYTKATATASSSSYNFTSNSRFRFRTDCSSTYEDITFDNIVITGKGGSSGGGDDSSSSCISIDFEDFEAGNFPFTIWQDGGTNCIMTSYYAISGSYSPYVRGNTNTSVMYTSDLDLRSYDSVTVEFDFSAWSFDSGEDFFVEFSDDGGSTWNSTPILQYIRGTDFKNNTTYTDVIATAESSTYNFTSNSRFRFRTDCSSTYEDITFDNIEIKGCSSSDGGGVVGIDSDGDGIFDSVDVDDDNDGLLDCTEKGITYGTISEVFDLNGTSTEISNTEFQLTKAINNQAGAATIIDRINFDDSFSFSFEAFLGYNDSGADGIAIIFHDDPNGASAVGAAGDGIGARGIQDGIVLELDTYYNSDRGDISNDHGMIWDSDNQSGAGFLTSPIDLGNLEDGNWHTININWNAPTNTISYYVDNNLAGSYSDDLINNYFGGNNLVFFGFSASTGQLNNTHRVRFNSVCDIPLFVDTDNDGLPNDLDIDSDNDGIPDNVEAQTTLGYTLPSGTVNIFGSYAGLWNNYGTGLTPEDTDFDTIEDYIDTNSDNDSFEDIAENGLANTLTSIDDDSDGLDNAFETTETNDVNWDVNEDIEKPSDLSILPDSDSDVQSGGDLDYRDVFKVDYPSSASIDFDGVNDYLNGDSILNGLGEVTIMGWIKIDAENVGVSNITIAGEDTACRLFVKNGNEVMFGLRTSKGISKSVSGGSVNYGEWHHVTGVFSGTTGEQIIYIDGKKVNTVSNNSQKGSKIAATGDWTGDFEIGRISSSVVDRQYFNGEIDEVRVFNQALKDSQIQWMVYQEIKEDSGNVMGVVIPKNIIDTETGSTLLWSSLVAYYPLTDIISHEAEDYSKNGNTLTIYNISTVQEQTAPMPYTTLSDGDWSSESTWVYGDVWDIENIKNVGDYGIVKISNNIKTSNSHTTVGLIIDEGKILAVNGDNLIKNTSYLELNGDLDLMNDSQLIQTETSDLVTSATGKVLRRQEGTPSAFWYNYWGAPVGAVGVTTLSDNNSSVNNPNNSSFKLDLLKDSAGFNFQFTTNYSGNGSISTYWLYAFRNGVTYWDWSKLSTSSEIKPGEGYTQKGTGVPSSDQQYLFEGKPNNGTILLKGLDKGGVGSESSVSKTEYLLGNPYASAIDIHKFIDDNDGVISGTIQFWQQWSGNSHHLKDYNGGYAQVNKLGGIRAYQFVGIDGAHNGSQDGTIVPTRYLPVGQGFMVEIIANGMVEFNNSQRVFIKEADADGSYDNGAVFSKNSNSKKGAKSAPQKNNSAQFKKIRLEFKSVTGPEAHRELLLGFGKNTSDSYDYGYDAENPDVNNNDLHLSLEGKEMNIQAYGEILPEKVVSLNFKSSGENSFEIKISEKENIEDDQEIYLKDNLLGEYFNIAEGSAYNFTSNQGKFNERFEIVFQSKQESLGIEEMSVDSNFVYYQNNVRKLFGKKLKASIKRFALVNMLGQTVLELQEVSQDALNRGIDIPQMSTGTYVAYFRSDDNEVFSKKIIIN